MVVKESPSIYNAYHYCERQAWLMKHCMNADQENDYMGLGRLIDTESFQRYKKKIYLAEFNAVIDMSFKKGNEVFIAEIKKSSAMLESGILQLKYYLYLLKLKGFFFKGILKIPKEKKELVITLNEYDEVFIEEELKALSDLLKQKKGPEAKKGRFCSKCAHFEFCFA